MDLHNRSSEKRAINPKESLEIQKLSLEVQDLKRWRWKWFGGITTVLISVLIATIGWTLEKQRELEEHRLQTQAHRDDVFARVLSDLASNTATRRIGAVVALTQFTQPGSDTAHETIQLLANRFLIEEDPAVLDQILEVLRGTKLEGLQHVADANRRAESLFGASVGHYVGLLVARRFSDADEDDWSGAAELISGRSRKLVKSVQSYKTESLSRLGQHLEYSVATPYRPRFAWPLSKENEQFPTFFNVMELVQATTVGFEFRRGGASVLSSKAGRVHDEEVRKALLDVENAARFLAWTSGSLVALLHANSGKLHGANLDGVALLGANLTGLDLSYASFRGSFFLADATNANLSFCDFSQAMFSVMHMAGANVSAATFTRTVADASSFTFGLPDLTGANWWDASLRDVPYVRPSKSEVLKYLEDHFPRSVNANKRAQLLSQKNQSLESLSK